MPSSIDRALELDAHTATAAIVDAMRRSLTRDLRRRGLVVAMSGGIDSSVCAALAARAVGPERVLGLFLPERESDPLSLELATECAERLGIAHITEDIAPLLDAVGCYRRRNEAIRRVVPEFEDDWGCKLSLHGEGTAHGGLNVSAIVVRPPDGPSRRVRLPAAEYREIVAASNFKQRARTVLAYFHADRLHYAVVGTPNRLEYDQGFFVKGGDGLSDIKPIAHLYKSQVYQLAEHLGVPRRIIERPPTTDTFSLPQSQEEFYYGHPTHILDRLLVALESAIPVEETAAALGLSTAEVEAAWRDIAQKRETTRYLHLAPQLVDARPTPARRDAPAPG